MPEITNLRISTLKHYERNPRKISKDQFEKLKNNMLNDPEFLSRRPILVSQEEDGTNIVYAGNQRLRAAKKLGWKELPCIVDICLSEEDIKRRVILDNLHNGEYDYDILAADYEPLTLLELGFTESQLNYWLDKEPDEKEEKPKKCCPHCGEAL